MESYTLHSWANFSFGCIARSTWISERIDISGREDGFKDGISVTSKKNWGGGHFESGCNAGYGILIFHSIPELNYFFEKYITHYEER